MFERRLKIFLGILIGITVVLLFRAAQVRYVPDQEDKMSSLEIVRR